MSCKLLEGGVLLVSFLDFKYRTEIGLGIKRTLQRNLFEKRTCEAVCEIISLRQKRKCLIL